MKWYVVGGSFMLLGTYEHKLDTKGRLVFPSKFREAFGEEAIASLGFSPCIAIYSREEWEKLFLSLKGAMYDKRQFQNFSRVFLATASVHKGAFHHSIAHKAYTLHYIIRKSVVNGR